MTGLSMPRLASQAGLHKLLRISIHVCQELSKTQQGLVKLLKIYNSVIFCLTWYSEFTAVRLSSSLSSVLFPIVRLIGDIKSHIKNS